MYVIIILISNIPLDIYIFFMFSFILFNFYLYFICYLLQTKFHILGSLDNYNIESI
jgi:hypothetical protein